MYVFKYFISRQIYGEADYRQFDSVIHSDVNFIAIVLKLFLRVC